MSVSPFNFLTEIYQSSLIDISQLVENMRFELITFRLQDGCSTKNELIPHRSVSMLSTIYGKQNKHVSDCSTPTYAASDNRLPACFSLFYRGRKAAKHGFKPVPSEIIYVPHHRTLVDLKRFELLTSALPVQRSPI